MYKDNFKLLGPPVWQQSFLISDCSTWLYNAIFYFIDSVDNIIFFLQYLHTNSPDLLPYIYVTN